MRISEFILEKLKLCFNPHSALHTPHLIKYFSLPQQWILLGLALCILALLYLRFYYHSTPNPEALVREFVVEVSGEVQNPGLYLFRAPPTLRQAIERAGGLKKTVHMDIPPSSGVLESGTLLMISRGGLPPSSLDEDQEENSIGKEHQGIKQDEIKIRIARMDAGKLLVFSIPLDLNQVSPEDLCLVPGIGRSLAQEIINYRERRRSFTSVEELKNVKGIGEKKWKAIHNFFIINQRFRADSRGS